MKCELGVSISPDHSDSEKDEAYIKRAANFGLHGYFRLHQTSYEIILSLKIIIKNQSQFI